MDNTRPSTSSSVGGGISGLATAFGLKQRGASVEVLEAARARAASSARVHRDGALYERGPNSALDTTPLINELLDALGIRGERRDASAVAATRFIVRGGRLVALPTSPRRISDDAGVLARRQAPPAARAVRRAGARRTPKNRSPHSSAAASAPNSSITRSTLSSSGVYAGDPERISVPAAFPRLARARAEVRQPDQGPDQGRARAQEERPRRRRTQRRAFRFAPGCRRSPTRSARAVGRVSRPACSVRRSSAMPTAHGRSPARAAASPFVRRAKTVVLAAPAYEAAKLLRELAPAAAQDLAAIEYAAIASVASAYRRDDIAHSLAGFGFLVPKKEQRGILGSLFSSSMFEGARPRGHGAAHFVPRRLAQPGAAREARRRARPDRAWRARGAGGRARAAAVDRDHALDSTRFRNTTSAIANACARSRTPSGAARPLLLRQLSRRGLGRRLHQVGARDGRRPSRAFSSAFAPRSIGAMQLEATAPAAIPAQVERRRDSSPQRRAPAHAGLRCARLRSAAAAPRPARGPLVVEPHLRLRDIGRHLADDARRVLVEHVRLDAGLREPVDEQVRVDALHRDEDPLHHAAGASRCAAAQPPTTTISKARSRSASWPPR